MKSEVIVIYSIFIGFALLEGFRTGFFRKVGANSDDGIVEVITAIMLLVVIQPTIILISAKLMSVFAPQYAGVLSHWSFIASFVLLLLTDDFVNYWWHRNAHNRPSFYKLHRPHHEGEYMSVRVVFRNGLFYYAFAPYYWIGGVLLFMGLGWAYAAYLVAKGLITFACHSDICWDKPLYANKWTSPIMWVVERVIVTPSYHHAHHGKNMADGVTHYKGNYGNMLSIWDVIFGTASITRKFPDAYGVEDLPKTSISEQLFWPLISTSPPIIKGGKSSDYDLAVSKENA